MTATTELQRESGRPRAGVESHEAEYDRFLLALRPGVMGPPLAQVLGGVGCRWQVVDAKYEPGLRATVLYAQGGRLVRGDVTAAVDGWDGLAVPLAGGRVLLHPFPSDPDLPQLPALMSGTMPAAPGIGASGVAAYAVPRTTLLRYRPGKRATVLLESPGRRLVAKAYHDGAKAASVAGEARRLEDAAADSGGRLRVPATVAHDAERAILVQRAVHGRPLDLMLATRSRTPAPEAFTGVRIAARALAALHAVGDVTLRTRDGDRELRRFGARARAIGTVAPATGEAATALAERLVAAQRSLPCPRTGLVHGDCKPSQFLVDEQGAYVMDLDHVGLADQAGDLGTFLASLRQLAVRRAPISGTPPGSPLLLLGDIFVDAYLRGSARDADAEAGDFLSRVAWQEAVALERKALRAFARAPRSPLAMALIREAQRCLDALEAS